VTRYRSMQLLFTILVFAFIPIAINADVPGSMNYQGYLTDSNGNPVADIPHNITFKIYDETSTMLWEESHILTTTNGIFSVQLGSNGTPLSGDVFNHAECWLGITVDTDPEIVPRTQLTTVPYAFRTGSVESSDIVNEPGVAAFSGAYYVFLDDLAHTVLCSLTINCPADGYVMAVAHGRIATLPEHTFGTNSYATVGISDVATALPGNQDLDFHIDSAAHSGTYSVPFGMTSMFTIPSAGAYTYYYLAYEYSGSVTVADMQFNLVYFPTAYGTVDPVPPPVKVIDSDGSVWLDGSKQLTTDTENAEPEALDIARLKRELIDMKAKLEAIQLQIDNYGIEKQ